MDYYEAYIGNYLLTFRDNLSVPLKVSLTLGPTSAGLKTVSFIATLPMQQHYLDSSII